MQESAVGGQGRLHHDRGCAAAASQRRRFGQRRQCRRIVDLVLCPPQPGEQIGAFVIGNLHDDGVLEGCPVPPGRFGRGQAAGGVVAGQPRPAQSLGEQPAQGIVPRQLGGQVGCRRV